MELAKPKTPRAASCFLSALALLAAAGVAAGEPIDVFILAGQSNANHRHPRPSAPQELRSFPTVYHSYHIRNSSGLLRESFPPEPYLLEAGEGFGPELGMFDVFAAEYGEQPLAVIQSGHGGTSLDNEWSDGAAWYAEEFVPFIQDSLQSLTQQGFEPTVRAVAWVQGETESGVESQALEYESRLEDFRVRLSEDLGGDFYFAISTLHSESNKQFKDLLLDAQEAVAVGSLDAGLVRPDDLPLSEDEVHLTATSSIELGRRLARSYLSYDSAAGDFDGDGLAGILDQVEWRSAFGSLAALRADANLDGRVTLADYTVWRDAFTPGPAPVQAPEPSALVLAAGAALMCGARRRR